MTKIGGITITQFNCDWGGNYLIEIGDKIALTQEDFSEVNTYFLSDIITYAGTLNESSEWEYTDEEPETYANPTNIGERINQTFAKVDKVNKEITLIAQDVADTASKMAELKLTTDSIELRVEAVENKEYDISKDENFKALTEKVSRLELTDSDIRASVSATEESINATNANVATLTNEVNLKVSADDVKIAITNTLNEGVDKVVTSTKKYTFDDTGLNIGSTDSEITTTVSEDGMKIYRQSQEVLVADNQGVKAEDLHATTYLIIGNNSRLEDWQNTYTACFWIGGNN